MKSEGRSMECSGVWGILDLVISRSYCEAERDKEHMDDCNRNEIVERSARMELFLEGRSRLWLSSSVD